MQAPSVLVVDPHNPTLDRLSDALRHGGFRVLSLSRYEAALPILGHLRPDAAVIGVDAEDPSVLKIATRFREVSQGTGPILYVARRQAAQNKVFLLLRGHGIDVLDDRVDGGELAAKLRAYLRFRRSIEKVGRRSSEVETTNFVDKGWLFKATAHEIRRAQRYGGGFSMLVGVAHGSGPDKLADELGRWIRQHVREADLVARVDEAAYAALLPGTPGEAAPALLERLSSQIGRMRIAVGESLVRPVAHFGMASFPDRLGGPSALLTAAFEDLRRRIGRRHSEAASVGMFY